MMWQLKHMGCLLNHPIINCLELANIDVICGPIIIATGTADKSKHSVGHNKE